MNAKIIAAVSAFITSTQAVNLQAATGLGQFFLPGMDYYHINSLEEFKAGLQAELLEVGQIDQNADQAINDQMLETARVAQENENIRSTNWSDFKSTVDNVLDNIQADIRMAAANGPPSDE